jgi:hypothetical protein
MRRRLACNSFYLEILFGLPFESPGRLESGRAALAAFTSQIDHSLDLNIGERVTFQIAGGKNRISLAIPTLLP